MRKDLGREVEKEMSIQEVKKLSPEKEKTQGHPVCNRNLQCAAYWPYNSCSEKKQGLVGTVLTTREGAFPERLVGSTMCHMGQGEY